MTEQELQKKKKKMTSEIPPETHKAFLSAASQRKEEVFVHKKISTGLILAAILLSLTITGFAASAIYNQQWWYEHRNASSRINQPDDFEAVMKHRVESPEQAQAEDSLVNVVIQDVSWAPEAKKLTISFKASAKEPDRDELHSQWALDTDGAYVRESGSPSVTCDGEDRAIHWLWRSDLDLRQDLTYGGRPGYGPVKDMMDDSDKRLLLIRETGVQMQESELELLADVDEFRTPEGEVIFVLECYLDWLDEEYDQLMRERAIQYPDMKEYAEKRIASAQAARSQVMNGGGIPFVLTYNVVEYIEGMPDIDLYSGGTDGQVEFIIQPNTSI